MSTRSTLRNAPTTLTSSLYYSYNILCLTGHPFHAAFVIIRRLVFLRLSFLPMAGVIGAAAHFFPHASCGVVGVFIMGGVELLLSKRVDDPAQMIPITKNVASVVFSINTWIWVCVIEIVAVPLFRCMTAELPRLLDSAHVEMDGGLIDWLITEREEQLQPTRDSSNDWKETSKAAARPERKPDPSKSRKVRLIPSEHSLAGRKRKAAIWDKGEDVATDESRIATVKSRQPARSSHPAMSGLHKERNSHVAIQSSSSGSGKSGWDPRLLLANHALARSKIFVSHEFAPSVPLENHKPVLAVSHNMPTRTRIRKQETKHLESTGTTDPEMISDTESSSSVDYDSDMGQAQGNNQTSPRNAKLSVKQKVNSPLKAEQALSSSNVAKVSVLHQT